MTSRRPYLIRAIYEWVLDNELTPYLLVDATYPDTELPQQYIEDGRIVLNISPQSVRFLDINNDQISFTARFSGSSQTLFFPIGSVLAIYAKENGNGMLFDADDVPPPSSPTTKPTKKASGRPILKVVK